MNEFLIDNIQREQHPMFIDIQPHWIIPGPSMPSRTYSFP
jgi:hypothetical protein